MELSSFSHKGLKRLYIQDDSRSIPSEMEDKLRKLLFAIETAQSLDQLRKFPGWRLHPLKGSRQGSWSLIVTGNWRLVFRYDKTDNSVSELDLIDYH